MRAMKPIFTLFFFFSLALSSWAVTTGLRDLSLAAPGGAFPDPAFQPTIYDYHLTVPFDIGEMQVRTVAADPKATTRMNGETVPDGSPWILHLTPGPNKLVITVLNADNTQSTYTVLTIREDITPLCDKFMRSSMTDLESGKSMNYRLFVPSGALTTAQTLTTIGPKKLWPLVVFLHGGAERGNDNDVQIKANNGAVMWARPEEQSRHPCFVFAPQAKNSATGGFGLTRDNDNTTISLSRVFEASDDLRLCAKALFKVMIDWPVDRRRIYFVGVSQGAFGVWNLAMAYPDLPAAIVSVSGGGDPLRAFQVQKIPSWVFHAELDTIIPVSYSRNLVASLRNLGANPIYVEYNRDTWFGSSEHFAWLIAFRHPGLRDWLFKQKRP